MTSRAVTDAAASARTPKHINASRLLRDDAAVGQLCDVAILALTKAVHLAIGQPDAAVAGLHFSDDQERAQVEGVIRRLLQAEARFEVSGPGAAA